MHACCTHVTSVDYVASHSVQLACMLSVSYTHVAGIDYGAAEAGTTLKFLLKFLLKLLPTKESAKKKKHTLLFFFCALAVYKSASQAYGCICA